MPLGSVGNPLRVAIVGSGPSGFYAAEHLQSQDGLAVQVDMYDRLPTPFGLVRGGVAPDHQKIKSVTRIYDKIARHPGFRFYGNVEFGRDVVHEDLTAYYHGVIYAVGARADRRMGIPREHLPGVHSATEFVGWYNAHPDYRAMAFDLTGPRAVVVGNGNVAMDVARILATPPEVLAKTDIADYALSALAAGGVREVVLLGRRGPAQAAFTAKELKEMGELPGVDVVVDPAEITLDALTAEDVAAGPVRSRDQNLAVLRELSERPVQGHERRIVMRFLGSPVELRGTSRVEEMVIARNRLYRSDDASLRPRATDVREVMGAGLVFRAIGYMGVPLPGLPFDARRAVIPNDHGRVTDPATGAPLPGEYVVGWIKRGPTGIIGTNKPDAQETVDALLEDMGAGRLDKADVPPREVLECMLGERRQDYVTYADWQIIDGIEQERGQALGAPRAKFSRVAEMLGALEECKAARTEAPEPA